MHAPPLHRRDLITGCLGGLWLVASGAAWAQPKTLPADLAIQAQAVVQAQLDAFAADDARRAFLLASPSARRHLGSPEHFINLVRRRYAVVYRPASVTFLKPQWIEDKVVLGVQMTDARGTAWRATYTLERQADGHLLISGCELTEDDGLYT